MNAADEGLALLPCPMCGGDAALNKMTSSEDENTRLNGRSVGYGVNCVNCGLNSRGIWIGAATAELAAEKWNTRAASAQPVGFNWDEYEGGLIDTIAYLNGMDSTASRNMAKAVTALYAYSLKNAASTPPAAGAVGGDPPA